MQYKKNLKDRLYIGILFIRNKYYGYLISIKTYFAKRKVVISYDNNLLRIKDITLRCAPEDYASALEACVFDDYQQKNFLKIEEGDIVLDIGAHIGGFSIIAAKMGAKVYAFEPDKRNFSVLLENIKLNKLETEITPFNFGIYSENRMLYFNTDNLNTGGHSVSKSGDVSIEVKDLPTVFRECNISHVDFMKIDVEGSEFEICKDDINNLSIQKIVGEYHLDWRNPGLNYRLLKKQLSSFVVGRYSPYYFYALKNPSKLDK
ncbi:MAG: hypothetical protein RIQ72_506 [Candidatus Parcubacteria bacterium]|jgi:FkbM family methyltransferase